VFPFAPQGRTPGYVKRYDYIFTGKNKDIIDCQLDFDTLFYIPVTAAKDKAAWAKTGGPLNQPNFNPDSPETTPRPQSYGAHPVSLGLISGSVQTTERSGAGTVNSVLAGDLQRAITLTARGDMINVNLRILGDPQFIKQDDIFYAQNLLQPQGQFISNNAGSSLWFDGGELYVFLNFESPSDYNEQTGVADPRTSKFRVSEMTGVYKVITVDSTFSKGKFEQSLSLVKLLYDQEGKPLQTVTVNRNESITDLNLGPIVANQYTRFLGPRVNLASLATSNTTAALLAVAASGGTSALTGLLQQGVNSVINQTVNKIGQQVGQYVGKTVKDAIGSASTALGGIKYDVLGIGNTDLVAVDSWKEFGTDIPELNVDLLETDLTDFVPDIDLAALPDISADFQVDDFLGF
jgi:hypothetical protein